MSILGRVVCNCVSRTLVLRPRTVRSFSLASPSLAKSAKPSGANNEDLSQPIQFSTSKASHRTWKVERSMGSRFQRPWWRVLPLSVLGIGFLLWCSFREESDVDRTLGKQLFDHLPGLLTNFEEDEDKTTADKVELQEDSDGSKS